jgi:hypothetical protein
VEIIRYGEVSPYLNHPTLCFLVCKTKLMVSLVRFPQFARK